MTRPRGHHLRLEADPTLSMNRLVRGVAAILRETADLRAHDWRYEVSGPPGLPCQNLPPGSSGSDRRALQPAAHWASHAGPAVPLTSMNNNQLRP